MTLDDYRHRADTARTIAPRLYTTTGGHDLDTHPALIHPPASLCLPCQDRWAAWGAVDLPASLVDGGGEAKRRRVIAQQREDLAVFCRKSAHARDRQATTQSGAPAPLVRPASFTGARIRSLLDDFEALLPGDGRTPEERLAAAVQAEKAAHAEWTRTRQPWEPTPAQKKEGAA